MYVLITISNVWHSKGDKECTGETLNCGLSVCRDMCDLDLYFGYL